MKMDSYYLTLFKTDGHKRWRAHLCGRVHVGEGALVGVGVGIEPGVKIPAWSIVKRAAYEITLADR